LRKLPKLEFLNGLSVDRDELYSEQGESNQDVEALGDHEQQMNYD
jgi:hypothetical protein